MAGNGTNPLTHAGAEAIMLAGIALALAFNKADSPFPLIDRAGIHADAAATEAFRESVVPW